MNKFTQQFQGRSIRIKTQLGVQDYRANTSIVPFWVEDPRPTVVDEHMHCFTIEDAHVNGSVCTCMLVDERGWPMAAFVTAL